MAHNTWFMGDMHLGHDNIITFVDNKGERIRPFESIEEHDETLIRNYNELVKPEDSVYFLGDLVMNRKYLGKLARFMGHKKLIKGNHDIFKLEDYAPHFEDIMSYRIYPQHGIIFSHIPVHPCQLERRFKVNGHGHTHGHDVPAYKDGKGCAWGDKRYLNLCPEKTGFKPVSLDDVLEMMRKRGFQ